MTSEAQTRLDRIEEKIDRLSEALVAIARTEEKLVSIEQKYSSQYDRMNRLSEKIDQLEQTVILNSETVSNITKISWVVVVAIVGAIITQFYNF